MQMLRRNSDRFLVQVQCERCASVGAGATAVQVCFFRLRQCFLQLCKCLEGNHTPVNGTFLVVSPCVGEDKWVRTC